MTDRLKFWMAAVCVLGGTWLIGQPSKSIPDLIRDKVHAQAPHRSGVEMTNYPPGMQVTIYPMHAMTLEQVVNCWQTNRWNVFLIQVK